jgi:CcmD family protein
MTDNNVVIVYSIIFLAIFAFSWMLLSRQKRLEKKLEDLKEELRDSSRK